MNPFFPRDLVRLLLGAITVICTGSRFALRESTPPFTPVNDVCSIKGASRVR
jgi:hypothetical protein